MTYDPTEHLAIHLDSGVLVGGHRWASAGDHEIDYLDPDESVAAEVVLEHTAGQHYFNEFATALPESERVTIIRRNNRRMYVIVLDHDPPLQSFVDKDHTA